MELVIQNSSLNGLARAGELFAMTAVLLIGFFLHPVLVSGLVLALAGLVLLHERAEWGFWLIVALAPVETFGPLSFEMSKLAKLALTGVVAVILFADSLRGKSASHRSPYRRPLALFLIAGIPASLLSRSPLMSLAGWSSVAIFAFFYSSVRRCPAIANRGPLLLKVILAGAVLSALLCLYQMTHGYSGVWASAEQQVQAADQSYDTLWPLVFRASAAFNGPNAAGAFLAMGTVIALARAYVCRRFRWWSLLAALICCAGMLSTFSRGALLGSIAGCLFALWVSGGLTRVRATGVLVIAGLLVASVATNDSVRSALRLGEDIASASPTRIDAWHAARVLIERNPLVGIGFYQFHDESQGLIGSTDTPVHPHNGFLKALVEEGPLGGLAYLLFVAQFVAVSRQSLRQISTPTILWTLASVAGIGASLFTQELFDAGFALGSSSIAILFASLLAVQAAALSPAGATLPVSVVPLTAN